MLAPVGYTSFTDVPSSVCMEPKYLNGSTSSSICPFICMLVGGLDAVDENLALVGADFHALFSRCFFQSSSVFHFFHYLFSVGRFSHRCFIC